MARLGSVRFMTTAIMAVVLAFSALFWGVSCTMEDTVEQVHTHSDDDGIPDHIEIELGMDHEHWDSDGDGLSDHHELIGSPAAQAANEDGSEITSDVRANPFVGVAIAEDANATTPNTADGDNDGEPDATDAFDTQDYTLSKSLAHAVHNTICRDEGWSWEGTSTLPPSWDAYGDAIVAHLSDPQKTLAPWAKEDSILWPSGGDVTKETEVLNTLYQMEYSAEVWVGFEDVDSDTIPNAYEAYGFTVEEVDGALRFAPWGITIVDHDSKHEPQYSSETFKMLPMDINGVYGIRKDFEDLDYSVQYFKTDAQSEVTDGDPILDDEEAKAFDAWDEPSSRPCVAAHPAISVRVTSFDLVANETITDSKNTPILQQGDSPAKQALNVAQSLFGQVTSFLGGGSQASMGETQMNTLAEVPTEATYDDGSWQGAAGTLVGPSTAFAQEESEGSSTEESDAGSSSDSESSSGSTSKDEPASGDPEKEEEETDEHGQIEHEGDPMVPEGETAGALGKLSAVAQGIPDMLNAVNAVVSFFSPTTTEVGRLTHSTCTNPAEAARLSIDIALENEGTADAYEVGGTFNLTMDGETVLSHTLDSPIQNLPAGHQMTDKEAIQMFGDQGELIPLEVYQQIASGAEFEIVPSSITAQCEQVTVDDRTHTVSAVKQGDWSAYENLITSRCAVLYLEDGNGTVTRHAVYASRPGITVRDALLWAYGNYDQETFKLKNLQYEASDQGNLGGASSWRKDIFDNWTLIFDENQYSAGPDNNRVDLSSYSSVYDVKLVPGAVIHIASNDLLEAEPGVDWAYLQFLATDSGGIDPEKHFVSASITDNSHGTQMVEVFMRPSKESDESDWIELTLDPDSGAYEATISDYSTTGNEQIVVNTRAGETKGQEVETQVVEDVRIVDSYGLLAYNHTARWDWNGLYYSTGNHNSGDTLDVDWGDIEEYRTVDWASMPYSTVHVRNDGTVLLIGQNIRETTAASLGMTAVVGTLDLQDGTISWQDGGTHVQDLNNSQKVYSQAIALDDDGTAVELHMISDGGLYCTVGSVDSDSLDSSWGTTAKIDESKGGYATYQLQAVDFSGDTVVAIYMDSATSTSYSRVGTIDRSARTIEWSEPVQIDTEERTSVAVDIRDDGTIAHAWSTQSGAKMYYQEGTYADGEIDWSWEKVQLGTYQTKYAARPPFFAFRDDGLVLAMYASGQDLMYGQCVLAYYSVGPEYPVDSSKNTLKVWDTSHEFFTPLHGVSPSGAFEGWAYYGLSGF